MDETPNPSQPSADPRYEWQGEHYEWQGHEVPSIQDNINPGRKSVAPPETPLRGAGEPPGALDVLNILSKVFAIIVLATPVVLWCGFSYPPLLWGFLPLFLLCGMGGIVLSLVGLLARSGRVLASGVCGLGMFGAICYGFSVYASVWP